jgi:pantoate--beta-alanine ligase
MEIVEKLEILKAKIKRFRDNNLSVAFVPTMGALHTGHLALVELAKKSADKVIVSIFVNPLQFDQERDFNNYPINLQDDFTKLEGEGADIVYLPSKEMLYPENFDEYLTADIDLVNCLCGKSRPGHMDGVVTVVKQLFKHVTPDITIFGEKDYQQLLIIKKLVADSQLPIKIIAAPIIREKTGLAMSSRNSRLSVKERDNIAPLLYKALCAVAQDYTKLPEIKAELLQQGFSKIDYFEIRNNDDLRVVDSSANGRIFIAANLGDVRLIDNFLMQ